MSTLAIKGHATRGSEVIALLEMLGGVNSNNLYGDKGYAYYIVDSDKEIKGGSYVFGDELLCHFTLEEFEEKFPYKVGDRVIAYAEGCLACFTIQNIRWNNKLNKIEYKICSSWCDASFIQPYKEETMEEKTYPPYMDYDVKTIKTMGKEILPYFLTVYDSEENKHEIVATDGYEIKEENGKYYAVKKKPQYPKTYKECCDVLGLNTMGNDAQGYKVDLIIRFQELLIARDAYWKIVGEQMGLNEPWKPDWKNDEQGRYMIMVYENKLHKDMSIVGTNFILVFPTEEMRDAFCENFKDLIEQCKELL